MSHKEQLVEKSKLEASREGFFVEFTDEEVQNLNDLLTSSSDSLHTSVEGDGYEDLRHLGWVSIDNDDTKDIDQVTAMDGDEVLVAIADVCNLIPHGSPLDLRARSNTTTLYLPGVTFPMLPNELCTNETSLNPGVDRKAVVFSFSLDEEGKVVNGRVRHALVHNHAQCAYPSIGDWLEGTGEVPAPIATRPDLQASIRRQHEIANALSENRIKLGALNFDVPDGRFTFDDEGKILAFELSTKNSATSLIEELMVASNGVSARFLMQHGSVSIHRIVKKPERWDRLREYATQRYSHLPAEPSSKALQKFLEEERANTDPETFRLVSETVVKLMGRGEYEFGDVGDIGVGHFGLATLDYTHSTAPNRRYPDMIAHRLIKCVLQAVERPISNGELKEMVTRCTAMGVAAEKLERRLRKSGACLLLEGRVGDTFSAIVTGVKSAKSKSKAERRDCFVRLVAEGFEYVEGFVKGGCGATECVGTRVRVKLVKLNFASSQIDFKRL